MDKFLINGGNKLSGVVDISGAKNAALPIMTASLLTAESLVLTNVPMLADTITMNNLLLNHGASVNFINEEVDERISNSLVINAKDINNFEAPYDIVRKMRASLWVLAPLVARFGQAKVSLPGGCAIGNRQVDLHLKVLEGMGVQITVDQGYIDAKASLPIKATNFHFPKITVGATITAIMAATLAEGVSQFSNVAVEPEIIDLCDCLIKMGAKIKWIDRRIIEIEGVKELHGCAHKIIDDRLEALTFLIAGAITNSKISIRNYNLKHIESALMVLKQNGLKFTEHDNLLTVEPASEIKPVNIETAPFPGFATDLQAQYMALMALASGDSIIKETLFENRFMHAAELNRMGANINVNGNTAIVKGVDKLIGAEVMATDLRASVSLVLAALIAEGETIVNRVYHIDRGYEAIEYKLQNLGADIKRVS